jgi:hypothetical protein
MDQPFFLLLLSFIPVIIYALMSPAAGSCLEGKERGGGKKNDEANWFIIRRLAERTEETGGTMVGSSLEWRRIRLWYRWACPCCWTGTGTDYFTLEFWTTVYTILISYYIGVLALSLVTASLPLGSMVLVQSISEASKLQICNDSEASIPSFTPLLGRGLIPNHALHMQARLPS